MVEVQDSVLASELLRTRVLSRYDLPGPVRCEFFTPGLNDSYEVHAGRRRFFLRVYRHGWRSRSEIDAEVAVLRMMKARRLPVSHPIARRDGRFVTRLAAPEGTRYAVLFSSAPGSPPDFSKRDRARSYGRIVADMHRCADRRPETGKRFDLDCAHLVDDPLMRLRPFLAHRPADLEYLEDVGPALWRSIEQRLPRELPEYGFCHGDHHGFNVHGDARGRMVVFDFDCYGQGYRAYDLAVFLWVDVQHRGLGRSDRAAASRRWNAFLDGYESVRVLSADERAATRAFVPIRHIWLMGLQAELTPRIGRVHMSDRNFDAAMGFIRGWVKHYRLL